MKSSSLGKKKKKWYSQFKSTYINGILTSQSQQILFLPIDNIRNFIVLLCNAIPDFQSFLSR